MNVRPSAIILSNNSLLTLRYCYGDKHVYALPGGNPDSGECLSDALERELNEELGIAAKVNTMVFSGEVLWPELGRETLHMAFETEITAGVPQLNPEQTTALEIVWIPLNELDAKLMYPNIGTHIAAFYQKKISPGHIGVIDQPYIQ
ncbi:NUDIX domain-containing protein [Dyadobacter flavalbus]|uniref:NUDIX domain-containing protein n=1 Tax=Dyadobacter flavalbus TaxID=2579942 RepID=A0A5M8R072_9BACT|nr:NUDIX domain-containing protein [Dyadobacter flavalbus]KAA6440063.1 NUDIX domain-containing protein [Dyadobacter flavalbus]